MGFAPEAIPSGADSSLEQTTGENWTPLLRHGCSFPPEIFREVMLNHIRNPNINSTHLFRADISLDFQYANGIPDQCPIPPRIALFRHFNLNTVMVRTMIPRNPLVDKPLDQTCLLYERVTASGDVVSLVVYLPHIFTPAESPFYHPAVYGIGFLHEFPSETHVGTVSIHYSFFDSELRTPKLERTAQHLLAVLHKHGQGLASGYVKRVQHDVIIPQAATQNTYARLKKKYARKLIEAWVEETDPGKHVFEDLIIAAFLIELWAEMYSDTEFSGFVDIGCGNGLLVHILLQEGYRGWGFDARRRKSWSVYGSETETQLKELILVPSIIQSDHFLTNTIVETPTSDEIQNSYKLSLSQKVVSLKPQISIHDGIFPTGTFIISNHADELTPWTPILANISESPFMMIPCCSHALTGAKFRAPAPRGSTGVASAFASLVDWVSKLASDCGWEVEKEMLRIPSTRNTALIGRRRVKSFDEVDIQELVRSNGGAAGWEENAMKLVKGAVRGH